MSRPKFIDIPRCCEAPETWLPIADTDGLYEVSDHGRVRSWSRTIYKPVKALVRADRPRLLKPGRTGLKGQYAGHGLVYRQGEAGRQVLAHRLVLLAFIGPPETADMETRHLNGNSRDNHLTNLKWGTVAENAADRATHGTAVRGVKHHLAILTEDDVRAIRGLDFSERGSMTQAARQYGVHPSTIARLLKGLNWAWLN